MLCASLAAPEVRADGAERRTAGSPGLPSQGWTGFYAGGHLGYAAGQSDWTATSLGAPAVAAGSFDFAHGYDAFKGTGSYFAGFQTGYNYRLPSGVVLGVEADVSAPNKITDTKTITSPAIGQASYTDTVEIAGSVRGRLGYVTHYGFLYGTAGYAWSYDHFLRTQLAGAPAGGTAVPGTAEKIDAWRSGWTAGGGFEVPVAARWTASLEYLFTAFGSTSVTFPAGAQRFDADLSLQTVRLGLNYQFGDVPSRELNRPAPPKSNDWSVHAQTTFVLQSAAPFRAPYAGTNSLAPNQTRETWDATFYLGWRLWRGAELWVNPEIDQGFGLSSTVGLAGFSSGEAYKLGADFPYARLPRAFVRQTIGLGGESEKVEAGPNQLAGSQQANRIVVTVGKFSATDIFDTNKYAHDPRSDFLNWTLLDTGNLDYAADAWGYTYGAAAEWYQGKWAFRLGLFDLSVVPNSTELDPKFDQFQWIGEVERRYQLWGQPGKLAVTAFLSRGRMGLLDDATRIANLTGQPADIAAVRQYRSRPGIAFNLEQQLASDLGFLARGGISNGKVETYEFTDVDRTIAAGLVVSGKRWGRPDDSIGFAGVINSISGERAAFLNAGGLGILVGDGKLPNPGTERIIETYYSLPVSSWRVTFDYQFVVNPAYNEDRGPVSIFGTRVHAQF